jgi:DNA-binding IclR family transcriptional regulator
LDRIEVWEAGAIAATGDLQGRTPALLVALFANLPHLTAALAEGRTGAGRSTVQRNMDALAARGLIREITGQGRYRVWTARL